MEQRQYLISPKAAIGAAVVGAVAVIVAIAIRPAPVPVVEPMPEPIVQPDAPIDPPIDPPPVDLPAGPPKIEGVKAKATVSARGVDVQLDVALALPGALTKQE